MLKNVFVLIGKSIKPKLYKRQAYIMKAIDKDPSLTYKTFDDEFTAMQYIQSQQITEQGFSQETESFEIPKNLQIEDNNQVNFNTNSQQYWFYYFKENEKQFNDALKKIEQKNTYYLFFDGASKFNPGPSSIGYLIKNEKNETLYENSHFIGIKTNNQAEAMGLLYGLRSSINLNIKKLICFGDSSLIINVQNKKMNLKDKKLIFLQDQILLQRNKFIDLQFQHIKRELNSHADKLANNPIHKKIQQDVNTDDY